MSRGIPDFPELELLGSCQITSQLPPLLLDRGDEAGFTGQPQHVCVRTFLQEGEGGKVREGSTGLGEQGFTCQLSQAAPVVGRHSAVPHGLGRAITDAFRAFLSLSPMHSPCNCWMLTIVRGPHPRAGPPPALQPPQGAGQGPWHWQMSDHSRLLLSG